MKYIVNSREMKNYDKNTMEQYHIPSVVLMERAALAVVQVLEEKEVPLDKILVVCGCGNNGGDGYAVARLLLLKGKSVDVVRVKDGAKETEENKMQRQIFLAYGGQIMDEIPAHEEYSAVIDAVFGVGLSRSVEGTYARLISQMNELSAKKIAVDISSGISSDTGMVLGEAFRADITVAFAFEKIGSRLWPGNEYAGEVIVTDIGIDEHAFLERRPKVMALQDIDLERLPRRKSHSNKGTFGKLLVVAGSVGMSGAAYLCAKAAYCSGCGLVRIVTPEENRSILQMQLPEAIITAYNAKKPDLSQMIQAIGWADTIVCGPGIGTTDTAVSIVKNVLKNAAVPVLLDADALNIVAQDTGILLKPHTEIVVTPHLGEMSRLCEDTVAYIQNHLIEVAEEFARQYNVICVLKDEHTVTSIPYRQTYLNLSGNSGMATAGCGDVLSGVIGGLLAQGMPAEDAASLGVYLHGRSGDVMQMRCSKEGMLASDLFEGLRVVLRECEK